MDGRTVGRTDRQIDGANEFRFLLSLILFFSRKHGFPTIMANMVVSSTSGKNINDLRDTIFNVACNVKENAGTHV